jgi:hypothetical protein
MQRRLGYAIDWLSLVLGGLVAYLVKNLPPITTVLRRHKKAIMALGTKALLGSILYAMSIAAVIVVPVLLSLTSENPFGASLNFPPSLMDYMIAGILAVVAGAFIVGSMRELALTNNDTSETYLY